MITLSDENSSRTEELAPIRTPSIPRLWIDAENYFFECCIWIAYAIYSIPCAYGALAWLGPAIILASILRVTGIPATEAQALRSKGELYRAYQRRVSAFVPWPPKRVG